MPQELAPALEPILKTIASLTERIRDYDSKLEAVAEEIYPETKLLRQVHGVGVLTALTFVLTLERILLVLRRAARLGLTWGWYLLAISREVAIPKNTSLQARKQDDEEAVAQQRPLHPRGPFGEDSDLRRHGEKIASRGAKNAKKRAVVAVARKLSVLLHRLWVTAEVYEPLYNASRPRGQAAA